MTRSHGEDPTNDTQGSAQHAHIGIRPKETRPRNVESPHHQHTRKRLAERHGNARIALVVPERDVELRVVLLDQVVFEEQGLRLAGSDDGVQIGHLPQQETVLRAVPVIAGEIVADPRAETFGLAHVDDFAFRVLPEVHPGTLG